MSTKAELQAYISGAVGSADMENRAALHEIMTFVTMEIPALCWGSRDKVQAWLKQFEEARNNG